MRDKLSEAEVLVLNGDIFDFRWSTLGDQNKTLSAALDWLRRLAGDFPGCQIHFIVGNHDCAVSFQDGLARLANALPRFQWHEYFLRIGSALFLHGDCAHHQMDQSALKCYRALWQQDRRRNPALAIAYECVDWLGITKRVHEWHFPRQKTVERIAFYLDCSCPGWREITSDCYFGHTHLPFANHEHAGIRFHNTGSAIHNLEFNPMHFEVTNDAG